MKARITKHLCEVSWLKSLSRVILVSLGKYIQDKIILKFKIKVCRKSTYIQFFRCRKQAFIARDDFRKQLTALAILYRNIHLRLDLMLMIKAPEVPKGQGLHTRFEGYR